LREKVRDWEGLKADLELLIQNQKRSIAAKPACEAAERAELCVNEQRLQDVICCIRNGVPLDPYLIL
jgi:hypothetical protein